jgi:predicted O-methyltransferase YrrM
LSLRLAPYHEKAPIFENGLRMWQWRTVAWRTTGSHFGYPMSVTSHIFRKQDLLQSIGRHNFTMPNQLERILRKNPIDRPYMLCYETPKIINNLANQVQTFNFCETVGESIKELEKRFLNGDRLSFEDIQKKAPEATTCFLKTEYTWENMKPNNWLSQYKKNITSQLGEDGILEKIFEVIGVDRGWCVDVGACDVPLSNTYVLVKKGWSGIFIEMVEDRAEKLKGVYRENAGSLVINKKVEPSGEDSLDNILKETSLPKEFDFLSIDIDGNDYHVWDSLKNYTPKVVVIEFNPVIKMDDYLQPIDGRGGASLSYMIKLGKAKGYELVSTTPFNAFFVKAEFFDKFGITDNSIKELFTDSDYVYGKDRTKHVNHFAFDYIVKKFGVDVSEPSPTRLPISRNVGFPDLLKELGVKKGVEVGVYKAKYSEVLMSRIPGLELVGIDAWQTYGNYKDYGVNDLEEKAYEDASAVAKRLGFRLMKAWSTDAAKEFADESLDFVYIDGNHDFSHVIEDLAAWSPKVKKDGIIAGHDFFESRQERYGVMYAVPAWCAYKRIPRLFIVADDRFPSWFYIKQ